MAEMISQWLPFALLIAALVAIPVSIVAAVEKICSRLDHIAKLLVWQIRCDEEDGDPDGPDEGEPEPVAPKTVVAFRRSA